MNIPPKFFQGNRRNLSKNINADLIVVCANENLQKSRDSEYKFHQDMNFYYLTGLNEAGYLLVIDQKSNEEFLIAPKLSEYEQVFHGVNDFCESKTISGIKQILGHKAGWDKLNDLLLKAKIVAINQPPQKHIQQLHMFTNPTRSYVEKKIKSRTKAKVIGLNQEISKLRMIKQPDEIRMIESAIGITQGGFSNIISNFKEYNYEHQIEADFAWNVKYNTAQDIAYGSIVANGVNACILHYNSNQDEINHDLPTVIDMGAMADYYCSDITRSYILPEKSSERIKQVNQAVKDIQDYAISIIKPGLKFKDYELNVREKMAENLIELNLVKNNDKRSVAKYYPHSTSHFLGLDVHDVGEYGIMQENMVITVEPGIYIPEEKIGIRIEDDVLITADGAKNLSSDIPYDL